MTSLESTDMYAVVSIQGVSTAEGYLAAKQILTPKNAQP